MTKELLQRCIEYINESQDKMVDPDNLLIALHAALEQPPVGYAILDQEGKVIGVEKYALEAGYWLNRGVSGRTIQPLYL